LNQTIVFFDFDGTLTSRDSLLPYLYQVVGFKTFVIGAIQLIPVLMGYIVGLVRNDVAKQAVLRKFLTGYDLDKLYEIGEDYASGRLNKILRPLMIERLNWHKNKGHCCVLVSASLDVYLKKWSSENGFDYLISSSLQADHNGVVSGYLKGKNCHGEEKVYQINQWCEINNIKCLETYGYGDSNADMPMLRLLDHSWKVSKNKLTAVV